jgi:hypothetical protein
MVSSKSYLYRLSVECDYYITEVSILQGNPVKQVLKNYIKTELWKLVISHSSVFCAILLFKSLIQFKQFLGADG